MGLCLHCNKWLTQTEGKKEKKFCNNTCRSNYWYSKNKKGRGSENDKIVVAPPQAQYDGPPVPESFTEDEPLSFDRISGNNAPKKDYNQYRAEILACENIEDLEVLGREIEIGTLPFRQKQALRAVGQQRASQIMGY